MMKFAATAIACLALSTTAFAQNVDVIKERQAAFKKFGDQVKIGKPMAQGQADFDLEQAQAVFLEIAAISKTLPDLFPDDSKTGAETEALAVIWEQKDDFNARFEKLASDASAAAGSVTDAGSFTATWGQVLGSCGGCHKVYRVEK